MLVDTFSIILKTIIVTTFGRTSSTVTYDESVSSAAIRMEFSGLDDTDDFASQGKHGFTKHEFYKYLNVSNFNDLRKPNGTESYHYMYKLLKSCENGKDHFKRFNRSVLTILDTLDKKHMILKNIFYMCKWPDFVKNYMDLLKRDRLIAKHVQSFKMLSRVYILYYCYINQIIRVDMTKVKSMPYKDTFDIADICPKPCASEPCDLIEHAIRGSCRNRQYAVFNTDFICICQRPYVWSTDNSACVLGDHCRLENISCAQGEKCIFSMNPVAGFECRSEAKKTNGTNAITTQTAKPFYPNYDGSWCKNGFLVTSQSNLRLCKCFYGWHNYDCTKRSFEWNPWLNWTECWPYSYSLRRGKKRMRTCQSKNVLDCVYNGTSVLNSEIEQCDVHRREIHGKWTHWSAWTLCSKKCGLGMKYATRLCLNDINDAINNSNVFKLLPCYGDHVRKEYCFLKQCDLKFTNISFIFLSISPVPVLLVIFYSIYRSRSIHSLYYKLSLKLFKLKFMKKHKIKESQWKPDCDCYMYNSDENMSRSSFECDCKSFSSAYSSNQKLKQTS